MLDSLEAMCNGLRGELKLIEGKVREIPERYIEVSVEAFDGQKSEMIAQSKLAVRHIEDARMRLGKVLQYAGDGVSIYDKI